MATSHAKPTPQRNLGARDERRAILRRLTYMQKSTATVYSFSRDQERGFLQAVENLRDWIAKRSKRTGKALGGVGRR